MIRNFEDKDFDWLLSKHGTCTFLLIQVLIGSFQKIRLTKSVSKSRLKIRLQFRLFREQGRPVRGTDLATPVCALEPL